jgi:hypothetical protein
MREPASAYCEEACSVHPKILTPASSCDFRNSASRSIARSDSDARLARNGPCLNEPERFVVAGSSVLSMSHEALALFFAARAFCVTAALHVSPFRFWTRLNQLLQRRRQFFQLRNPAEFISQLLHLNHIVDVKTVAIRRWHCSNCQRHLLPSPSSP